MPFKTITTIMCDAKADMHTLNAAIALARREEAHLDVICLGLDRTQLGFYYAGTNAMILQDNLQIAQKESEDLEAIVNAHLAAEDIQWATLPITAQMVGLTVQLSNILRYSDLVILPRPYGPNRDREHEEILEAALFSCRVPVLVMPDDAVLPDRIQRVVVAWNDSSEALGAIRAALPVLSVADNVNIAIIDPPTHGPDRSDPGGALCQMLARHGVQPEVSVLAKTMPRVTDVLSRHVSDQAADMLVMGAYGHSRFRESILGGATRDMLEMAEVPVFMSH
ncbi:universal stress protein [Pacificibacter marinus]|uniref:Universal stress protein family protein n=1 Tax=Pacificibacter marinus TaxID=658057 RepID=A0A1Y5S7L1_9RHOB|nr:universal stress protein [Pacificibacter marinus]SEK78425.1 Universal stress protein family protein [Pacificibacter marinus]SLN33701.1 Universal stress protein family protein [Pacificibacter marinus]